MYELVFPLVNGDEIVFMDTLNILIGDNTNSFIDLGCCHASQTCKLKNIPKRKYVDIIERILSYQEEQQFFEVGDILKIKQNTGEKYSVSFALDVPEHLYKEDGVKLYNIMGNISDKVICFTPLDEWMMTNDEDKNPESHRSIWKPKDLDDTWIKIIFPVYHQRLNIGAWFYMKCDNLKEEFDRIQNELKQKSWA